MKIKSKGVKAGSGGTMTGVGPVGVDGGPMAEAPAQMTDGTHVPYWMQQRGEKAKGKKPAFLDGADDDGKDGEKAMGRKGKGKVMDGDEQDCMKSLVFPATAMGPAYADPAKPLTAMPRQVPKPPTLPSPNPGGGP